MKKIFIKDDRLREIIHYRNEEIARLLSNSTIKGSYRIKLSTKAFKNGIYFGWDIIDDENGWKIDELDNFEITIKKDGKYYYATCEQFFTENVICPLMVGGKTVEGTLIRFIEELKKQKKTLCIRGKTIEGEVEKAIYEQE